MHAIKALVIRATPVWSPIKAFIECGTTIKAYEEMKPSLSLIFQYVCHLFFQAINNLSRAPEKRHTSLE